MKEFCMIILGYALLCGTLGFMFSITFNMIRVNPLWGIVPATLIVIGISLIK